MNKEVVLGTVVVVAVAGCVAIGMYMKKKATNVLFVQAMDSLAMKADEQAEKFNEEAKEEEA